MSGRSDGRGGGRQVGERVELAALLRRHHQRRHVTLLARDHRGLPGQESELLRIGVVVARRSRCRRGRAAAAGGRPGRSRSWPSNPNRNSWATLRSQRQPPGQLLHASRHPGSRRVAADRSGAAGSPARGTRHGAPRGPGCRPRAPGRRCRRRERPAPRPPRSRSRSTTRAATASTLLTRQSPTRPNANLPRPCRTQPRRRPDRRDEVRRHLGGRRRADQARRRADRAGGRGGQSRGGGAVRARQDHRRAGGDGIRGVRAAVPARDGHAALHGRADLMRAGGDGDQRPRTRGDLAHRLPGRHRDRHLAHQGADPRREAPTASAPRSTTARSCWSPASRASPPTPT